MPENPSLKAPPEVDVDAIARQVCGWRKSYNTWYSGGLYSPAVSTGYVTELMEYSTRWEPDQHLEHAWEIVTALQAKGYTWTMHQFAGMVAFSIYKECLAVHGIHPDASMAICLAAMQLVEKDNDDE